MPDQPVQSPNDWNSYLSMLDLSNPTLGAYLRSVLPNLATAVPPAGQYITSMDYETLKPALSQQYVSEVIQKYEAILGPSPELYQAAVAQGALTPEQADAMSQQSATGVGSLQQQFAAKGGIRTLAGPYQAQRTELLKQAIADVQAAGEKASTDAYNLASQTTGQRVTALSNAGQIGSQLVGHGVSRRNSQGMEGAAEQGPMDLPAPPKHDEPSIWEKLLLGALPAGIAAGGALAGRALAPAAPERVNPILQKQQDQEAADEYNAQRDAQKNAEERPPGWQGSQGESPQYSTSNPYAGQAPQFDDAFGGAPYGGGPGYAPPVQAYDTGGSHTVNYNTGAYNWQTPTPAYQPQPQSAYNPYTGNSGNNSGNEDYYGGYGNVPTGGGSYGQTYDPWGGSQDYYQDPGNYYSGGYDNYDYSNYQGWYE